MYFEPFTTICSLYLHAHSHLPLLAEQYESFVKFTQDQIMRRYGTRPASCKYSPKTFVHFVQLLFYFSEHQPMVLFPHRCLLNDGSRRFQHLLTKRLLFFSSLPFHLIFMTSQFFFFIFDFSYYFFFFCTLPCLTARVP